MTDVSVEELIQNLKKFFRKEENRNYLYLSSFFLVFSFFLFFVIRPTLKSAFESKSKREDLSKATAELEQVINKAVTLQSEAERYRDDFFLLFEAVPDQVHISRVMRDITTAIRESDLVIVNASVSDIRLVGGEEKGLKKVILKYVIEGEFSKYLKFLDRLNNQRRLKKVKKAIFLRKGEVNVNASGEATVNIKLEIETYFL